MIVIPKMLTITLGQRFLWRYNSGFLTFPFFRRTKKGFVRAASLFFPKILSVVDPCRMFFFSDLGDTGSILKFEIC